MYERMGQLYYFPTKKFRYHSPINFLKELSLKELQKLDKYYPDQKDHFLLNPPQRYLYYNEDKILTLYQNLLHYTQQTKQVKSRKSISYSLKKWRIQLANAIEF